MLMTCRYSAPSQPNKLENGLYVSFIAVIQDDVQGELRQKHDQRQCADLDQNSYHTSSSSSLLFSKPTHPDRYQTTTRT